VLFLVLLPVDKLQPELIHMASQKIISHALECRVTGDIIFDVVGTGGDKWDTWNVSTGSAIVLACCGIKVAKHGNRSQSGRVGSADFMEALGANIFIDNNRTSQIIEELGFGFLFSQQFHPAIKQASSYRKEIGVRTIFNVLGPLVNPTRPTHMVVGVSLPELGTLYSKVLSLNPHIKHAMVVHSTNGMDEVGIDCETHVWSIKDHKITEYKITPEDFGISRRPIESVIGGQTGKDNAKIFWDILDGKSSVDSYRDWLCMNCACCLVLCEKVKNWTEGFEMVKKVLNDGSVRTLIESYIQKTK